MTKGNFVSKLDRYDLSILAELQRDARISNQELAERIGRPTATRAVGAANGRNPLPIVLPDRKSVV